LLRSLPLESERAFFSDPRNPWAAESCLRRVLESLLDIGRHILAKGYGIPVPTYKEIGVQLGATGAIPEAESALLTIMAGYRNRMVHFYYELDEIELYQICANQLADLEMIRNAFQRWTLDNPDKIDRPL
jgi:uncharacterized protein YutE (UPF0331/DUF86 family)